MPLRLDPKYQIYKDQIDKCNEDSDRLSKWEKDFIESIDEHLSTYGKLSERQTEILERIYTDKTRS